MGEGSRPEQAMRGAVGVGCDGAREEMDGDHFRPCRGHPFPLVGPVLLARSASSRSRCRLSNTGRTLDIIHSCVF